MCKPSLRKVNTNIEIQLLVNKPQCNKKHCYNAHNNYLLRLFNLNKFMIEKTKLGLSCAKLRFSCACHLARLG